MNYSLNRLYQAVGLTKQAVNQQFKRQQRFDLLLSELIIQLDLLRKEHPGCGLEKAYRTLQPTFIGRDRFVNIFMDLGYGVKPPKKFIKTTKSVCSEYENLIEGLLLNDINQVVQSDITYFLVDGLFYYLVFLVDVFSKRIVGFQASNHLRVEANMATLKQMIKLRGKNAIKGLIHHSDRGSQYVAKQYTKLLTKHECFISVGFSAQENAYAERVNGIIKNEFLNHWKIKSFSTLKNKLKMAVQYYNNHRIHDHLPNNCAPTTFEYLLSREDKYIKHRELIFSEGNFVKRNRLPQTIQPFTNEKNLFCPIFIH